MAVIKPNKVKIMPDTIIAVQNPIPEATGAVIAVSTNRPDFEGGRLVHFAAGSTQYVRTIMDVIAAEFNWPPVNFDMEIDKLFVNGSQRSTWRAESLLLLEDPTGERNKFEFYFK